MGGQLPVKRPAVGHDGASGHDAPGGRSGKTEGAGAHVGFVDLYEAKEHEFILSPRHAVHDLAPHRPGGLGGDAELSGQLGAGKALGLATGEDGMAAVLC